VSLLESFERDNRFTVEKVNIQNANCILYEKSTFKNIFKKPIK